MGNGLTEQYITNAIGSLEEIYTYMLCATGKEKGLESHQKMQMSHQNNGFLKEMTSFLVYQRLKNVSYPTLHLPSPVPKCPRFEAAAFKLTAVSPV